MLKRAVLSFTAVFALLLSVGSMPSEAKPDRKFGNFGLASFALGSKRLGVQPIGVVRADQGFRVIARVNGDVGVFAYKEDGSPDRSFGRRGWKLIEVVPGRGADWDVPNAIARQSGKTIVAGGITYVDPSISYRQLTVTRITDTGEQDRRFGKDGVVRLPGLVQAWGVDVDEQGRILTVGTRFGHDGGPLGGKAVPAQTQLVRLSPDGTPDRSFGKGGVLRLGGKRAFKASAFSVDGVGRILLAGTDPNEEGEKARADRLIRLKPNGKPDRSFGNGGTAETPSLTFWSKSMTLSGNRIYLGGERASSGSGAVLRYTANGALDGTFGEGGALETGDMRSWGELRIVGIGPDATMLTVVRDGVLLRISEDGEVISQAADTFSVPNRSHPLALPDGSFVSAPNAGGRPALARVDRDFQFDESFNERGLPIDPLTAPTADSFESLVKLSDGGLASASFSGEYGADLTVGRFTAAGSPVKGFGKDGFRKARDVDFALGASLVPGPKGRVSAIGAPYQRGKTNTFVRFGPGGSYKARLVDGFETGDIADAVGLPGGRFLVAGGGEGEGRGINGSVASTFRVARYLPSGAIDRSFGKGGTAQVQLKIDGVATSLTRDRRGRIIVVGGICSSMFSCVDKRNVTQMVGVARFLPDGRIDRAFGRNGAVQYRFGLRGYARGVAALPDGRIAVHVTYDCLGNCDRPEALLMLRGNGRPDRRFGKRGRIRVGGGRTFWINGLHPGGRGGLDVAATFEPCGGKPGFSVLRYDTQGQLDRQFGGGDGILSQTWPLVLGSYGLDSVKQNSGTLTFSGYVERRGPDGGAELLPALSRINLAGADGRTSTKGCTR